MVGVNTHLELSGYLRCLKCQTKSKVKDPSRQHKMTKTRKKAVLKSEYLIGVKTTSIYCLPSCPAREPLPQNVVRFKSAGHAERNGFRPCKRCFPDFPYGKWVDQGVSVLVRPPQPFDFLKCLKFLARSPLEPCHVVENNVLYKLEKFDGQNILMKIQCRDNNSIWIEFLTSRPKKSIRAMVAKYVWQWFDLDTDLGPFYRMAGKNPVLNKVTTELYGLRILTIPDLFEAICWAIIGQQINLRFAYTLKKRFVESFGEQFTFHRRRYYLFPTPQDISRLTVADLRSLQFTTRKSEYIIELAKKIQDGDISRKGLLRYGEFETARKILLSLRGVGRWTAEYVSLRCLRDPAAFPDADVGLLNAVKQQLGLSHKPTAEDIIRYSNGWEGWQAYATFYLWASLIG